MKPYIITYDIKENAENSAFTSLFEEIKKSKKWWHYITNSWIIISDETPNQILERLKPFLDSNINLLVFELGNQRQGWLPEKAWKWIRTNIPTK